MPDYSLFDIANALGGQCEGNGNLRVTGATEPRLATPQTLALAMSPKYADDLAMGSAVSALLWPGADWQALGLQGAIFPVKPRLVMAGLTGLFDPGPDIAPGIHPTAVVDPDSDIAADCAIGPFTSIGAGVVIESGCRIAGHVSIARGARLGRDCLIHAGVRIETDARIGNRVIVHPNAVIGADGFSFVTEAPSSVERTRTELTDTNTPAPQTWVRVHSLGTVRLEDDVEIGSNSNVDRGTLRETVIGRGTKIDNQVQIGHNVLVGEDCMICSQAGIAGSARVGNRVVLAGRVAVNDNIFVGDDVVAGGAAKLFTNVPAGRVVLGDPAIKITAQMESYKAFRRLPRLMRDVAALKNAVMKTDDKG